MSSSDSITSSTDCNGLFAYPDKSTYQRVMPKNKLFAHSKPPKRIRDLITSQIAQIVWQQELSPATTNLPSVEQVGTIQVFRITLKPAAQPDLHEDVLRYMDQAVPSPIFFELIQPSSANASISRIRTLATYKRPSEADSNKWVIGSYFQSPWLAVDAPRMPLPVALDMGSLYEQMLRCLMPYPARPAETIRQQALRHDQIAQKQRECQRLETQLHRLKQFNRKVELNSQIQALKAELEILTK